MKLRDHEVWGFVGMRGAGKSRYVKARLVRPADRVVVWDPQAEYAESCDLDEVSAVEFANEAPELLGAERCKIAVVPDFIDTAELAPLFAEFLAQLKTRGDATKGTDAGPCLIVVEETALLRPRADGNLVALATQSRHWRMPLVLVSQRATMQPPGARGQWSHLVSFLQTEPGDLDALAERIGDAKARRVAELPRHKFVEWDESESFKQAAAAAEEQPS